MPNPILVEVHRNEMVESAHRGSAVVVDTTGQVVAAVGDRTRTIYPRSALKLLQAIPLVESGAADHFALSARELTLACASHNGEAIHTDTVLTWLQRLALTGADLENGPEPPMSAPMRRALTARGQTPSRIHHNCSGKHTGMLTLARFLGGEGHGEIRDEVRGYSEYPHAVQQTWLQTIGELVGLDATAFPWARDGCGVPAICMPMRALAYGYARLAEACGTGHAHGHGPAPAHVDDHTNEPMPTGLALSVRRAEAVTRLITAITAEPLLLAGHGRCCSDVIRATDGKVIVKMGAEGVYAGFIPALGVGFALKIDDGNRRASEVALGALLNGLGVVEHADLDCHFRPAIINSQGIQTGVVCATRSWRDTMTVRGR